jgi:hypothetical protein
MSLVARSVTANQAGIDIGDEREANQAGIDIGDEREERLKFSRRSWSARTRDHPAITRRSPGDRTTEPPDGDGSGRQREREQDRTCGTAVKLPAPFQPRCA